MAGRDFKSGFVSIIGRPNVGKSTLMNAIIGQKIAITSNKPQTTRNRIRTIYTDEAMQIVFVDTPGIHKAKTKLGDFMVKTAMEGMKDADVILWLVEPTTYIGAGEQAIIKKLKSQKTPVILVINKVDTVQKDEILLFMDTYRKEMDFAEIVPVSALKSRNLDTLLQCISKYLPYGEPYFDEDMVTDQPMRQIAAEMIREKALRCLGDEIPHGIAVTIDQMDFGETLVDMQATIYCERESHKGIIIGKGGAKLKEIGTLSRKEIEEMVELQVNLKLWVKVKENWRDSDFLIKNFGYHEDEKK